MTTRQPESTGAAPHHARRSVLVAVALVVVVVALVAWGTVSALALRDHDPVEQQSARKAAATSAARAEVVSLVTVSTTTAAADIKKLLAGATASFRDQFASAASAFQQTLKAGNVSSTGTVTQSGVVSLKGNTAVLLVAATATVKNASAPSGEPRSYRFKLTMTETGGRWLVSDLGFVA